jgi:hypothetical protein
MIHETGFFIEPKTSDRSTSSSGDTRIAVQMGIKPYDINVQKRGFEPEYLHLHYTDDRFDKITGMVNLVFVAGGKTEIYKNWVVVRTYRYDSLTKVILLADVRHLLTYAEFTGGFNITVAGSENEEDYREGTLNDGQPYTDSAAIQSAITAMLAEVGAPTDVSVSVSPFVNPRILPANLGNSPYGGFHGVRLNVVGTILGYAGDLELVPTQDGKLMIVDKYHDVAITHRLNQLNPVWETAAARDNRKPERPSKVIYTFGKRVERRFRYREGVQVTSAQQTDLEIENVMPIFESDTGEHEELFLYIQRSSGYSPGTVVRRALIPAFYPWTEPTFQNRLLSMGAEFYAKLQHIAGQMPGTFRSRFRVRLDSAQGEVLRPYVDLQLGHLKSDGTTQEGGSVYMNYVRHLRFSYDSPHASLTDDVLNQVFTENVPFDPTAPAPFVATWLVGNEKEVMFEVVPEPATRRYRTFLPGNLVQPFRYPTGHEMQAGMPWGVVEATMELTRTFSMDVIYNGYQVEARPNDPVRHSIERAMDGSSPVPLYWPIPELEALFKTDLTLINEEALNEAIDHYHAQLEKNYADGRHGTLRFPGVLPARVRVEGNIHAKHVRVGFEADHAIDTILHIASGIDEFKPLPQNIKGVPPRKIG